MVAASEAKVSVMMNLLVIFLYPSYFSFYYKRKDIARRWMHGPLNYLRSLFDAVLVYLWIPPALNRIGACVLGTLRYSK